MGLSHSPKIVTNGLVLALDAANNKSYPRSGTVWSSGWAGSFSNPTYSFDGNLSTATIQNGTATYTFAGGGLSVSGTVRIYVTFGASSGQVSGLPNVIVVDGTDVSSKMAAANVYSGTPGWIDITSEVGSVFNTIVMTGTGGRSNPSIYAVEVNGQILIDAVAVTAWTDLSGNNNTGTLINGPTFNAGNQGSIVFDGVDDYVTSPFSTTSGQSLTYVGWLYSTESTTTYRNFIDSNVIKPMIWWNTSGQIEFDTVNNFTTTATYRNKWVHVALSKPSGSSIASYYVNGMLASLGSELYTTPVCTPTLFNRAASNTWKGYSSIVQIYNRSLTAAEVLQNYNATKSRFGR